MRAPDRRQAATATGRAVAGVARALDRAVPKCELALSAAMRRPAAVRVAAVDAVSGAEVGAGAGRSWFRVGGDAERSAALALDTAAVVRLADVLMGGHGAVDATREPGRLELGLVAGRLTAALAALGDLLAAQGVAPVLVRPVEGPAELTLGSQLVKASLAVSLGGAEATIDLLVPLPGHAAPGEAHADPTATLLESLAAVPLWISLRFPPVRLAAADLDGLEVGDVIRLDQPAPALLVAEVDRRPLFRARTGRQGARLAVEVLDVEEMPGHER